MDGKIDKIRIPDTTIVISIMVIINLNISFSPM
jgi:hypothetical protein